MPRRIAKVVDVRVEAFDRRKVIHPHESYSLFHAERILKNYDNLKETFVITIKESINKVSYPERVSDLKITEPWFMAVDCLGASLYPASILMSSIAVESALNHDMRLDSARKAKSTKSELQWLNLTTKTLLLAQKEGLPVTMLMNKGERLDKRHQIEFLRRRNKITHGDFLGFSNISKRTEKTELGNGKTLTIWPRDITVEDVVDEVNKARNFLVRWAESKPKLRLHYFKMRFS